MKRQDSQETGHRAWILVVHREAGHARPVETLLEGAGYEVVSADKADEIRTLVESGRPDLVVVAGGDPSILPAHLEQRATRIMVVDSQSPTVDCGLEGALRCPMDGLVNSVAQYLASQADRKESKGPEEA